MLELSIEYANALANQSIFISALLCGFSLTVLVLLLEQNGESRLKTNMFKFATISTGAFLIAIFAMTKTIMMTTPGYPLEFEMDELTMPRIVGGIMFFIGILSVTILVSLSGWTKSKSLGRFTTIVGIITLIFVFMFLS